MTLQKKICPVQVKNTGASLSKERKKKWYIKVFLMQSIKIQLIGGFLIPVLLIIALGALSYSKASDAIITNYEDSSMLSVDMIAQYLTLGLGAVETKATEIALDQKTIDYYSGKLKEDRFKEFNSYTEISNGVKAKASKDEFIYNINIFGEYGGDITYMGVLPSEAEGHYLYNELIESQDGGKPSDTKAGTWAGSHPELDKALHISGDAYCMSLFRQLKNIANKQIGYVVIDVRMDFIQKVLERADFGEGSLTGVITGDGREIVKGGAESSFSRQSFYTKAMEGEAVSDKDYVEYGGKKCLFLYSKLSVSDSMVYTIIPMSGITGLVSSLRLITVICVLVASVIAIAIGTFLTAVISQSVQKAKRVLEQAATGDLSGEIRVSRRDEFSILAVCINRTLGSIKELIMKMTSVSSTVSHSAEKVAGNSSVLLPPHRILQRRWRTLKRVSYSKPMMRRAACIR